jgi:hypothetical protein
MSKVDHEKKFLLQLTILAALKVTPAKVQKKHFCTECARACCISSSHLIISSTTSLCKARARARARPPTATAFVATAPRVALIFVALIVNIVSCNKNFIFHGLPSTLLQLFYFSLAFSLCSHALYP